MPKVHRRLEWGARSNGAKLGQKVNCIQMNEPDDERSKRMRNVRSGCRTIEPDDKADNSI